MYICFIDAVDKISSRMTITKLTEDRKEKKQANTPFQSEEKRDTHWKKVKKTSLLLFHLISDHRQWWSISRRKIVIDFEMERKHSLSPPQFSSVPARNHLAATPATTATATPTTTTLPTNTVDRGIAWLTQDYHTKLDEKQMSAILTFDHTLL